jgi:hypothetical protein
MLSWRHSGFNVYIGDRINFDDKASLGNLARYIIRACFSQERMIYIPAETSMAVPPRSSIHRKTGSSGKLSSFCPLGYALDWLARLVMHISGS